MAKVLSPPTFKPAIDYKPGDGPVLVTATGVLLTLAEVKASHAAGYRSWLMHGTAVGVVGKEELTVAYFAADVAEPIPVNFTEDFGRFLNRNFPWRDMNFRGEIEKHTVKRGIKDAGRTRKWGHHG